MSQAYAQLIAFNEREFQRLPANKQPVFVYEWLKNFEDSLNVVKKADLKAGLKDLVGGLTKHLYGDCGPPTRQLLGRCFAQLYLSGDQFSAFDTVNTCSDIIRGKDDANLSVKLAAMATVGMIFEKLGRMVGGSAPETVQILIKAMKNSESQGRCEILLCCQRILYGLGSAASSCHKDIFKSIRTALIDRSMAVRCAAAECTKELIKHAMFTYTTELETLLSVCLKALEGSNYDVRVCVSSLLGKLMAATQRPPDGSTPPANSKTRKISIDEMFDLMSSGFLRGGIGFLKGGSGELLKTTMPQEVRVGVTQAYVVLFNEMGGTWVEKNVGYILGQVLDLLSSAKATPNHVDAVYSRKCVSFILRSMLGRLLGEKAQVIAGKELCKFVSKQMTKVKQMLQSRETSTTETTEAVLGTQHTIICALQELACLVQDLATAAGSLVNEKTIEIVFSVLIHSAPAVRLNAAWCLRTITVAIPSHLTPMIDQCLTELETSSSLETVSGYAYTLSALIGGVRMCPLGIPHKKGKLVFGVAEEMLKRTTEDTKWAMIRAKCGWMITGALMTLGPSTVRHFLPKMLGLWASAFPPTPDEAESEKSKGDPYTWQVTLECRSGALAALSSFIKHCPALLSDDIVRRVMIPLESCVAMTAHLPAIVRTRGNHLKVSAAMIRLRLYEAFRLLPPKSYEGLYNAIIRELVSEFTLTSNQSMTTTSLLRTMCHKDDSILLGTWLQETDHKSVEDQLQPNSASGSGALEHDYSCLFTYDEKSSEPPGPLPLGVAVIDASIKLFGLVFPHIAQKHRNQLLSHFATCIKNAKAAKAQAITMNIFTAFLSALRSMGEAKSTFGDRDVRSTADNLVMSALNNLDPILRCAAAEALGRMAQVVDEPAYVAQIAQSIFAKIQGSRDAVSRTGHSIALGCLHRYVGGMGAGQHTQTSVSILLALAQDMSSSIVQVWALHALALIADCGGPMFRSYVEPTLEQVMSLLLSVPPSSTEIHQCLGKCLAALITSIGPELQDTSTSIKDLRSACLVAASVMQNHPDSIVQSEAISCLQQLHIFAPRHVNLSTLVPSLCTNLSSAHLILRRAAVACLRQLSQREAKDVCEHALACKTDTEQSKSTYLVTIGNDGLGGALFGMLDTEVDRGLRSNIQDCLNSMLQTLAPDDLTHWLGLCKNVLSAAKTEDEGNAGKGGDDEDDESGGMGAFNKVEETHPTVAPRWPTRVFASESVQKIMSVCEQQRAHFDLALARELKKDTGKGDYLVMHLSELVRLAFIAATATSDQLKLEGLKTLQEIVKMFSAVEDPDYAGHVILEQFQAQVGAALRPAFAVDTPADVTATACEVCSTWIASGVSYDLNDVRRIQQLLVTSLSKFGTEQDSSSQLYNESANTMEKLAVLKAWAQVYIVAMKEQNLQKVSQQSSNAEDVPGEIQEPLISLVSSHIQNLSHYWLGALKDYGYLSLPPEYASQLPPGGGMFYGPESMNESKVHYQQAWPPILHAAALWLNAEGFENAAKEVENIAKGNLPNTILNVPRTPKSPEDLNTERFHLVLGLCVKALCSTRLTFSAGTVTSCVNAVNCLLEAPWARDCIGSDSMLSVELLNVLHRLLLTRDSLASHVVIMSTVSRVVHGARDVLTRKRTENSTSDLGESEIEPGKSVVFGAMETCMCLLSRYFPSILADPEKSQDLQPSPRLSVQRKGASNEFSQILSKTVSILCMVPDLCTSRAVCDILPIVLRLVSCVFEEAASYEVPLVEASKTVVEPKMPHVVSSTLKALKELVGSQRLIQSEYSKEFIVYFQSCLLTIITPAKEQSSTRPVDDCSVMAAIALFVLAAPLDATAVASLHEDCVEIFIRCVNLSDTNVQLKAIETCYSMFSSANLSRVLGYIHSVGPHIVSVVQQAAKTPPSSEAKLTVVQKSIDTVELLVGLVEEERRTELLSIYLPLLVNLLLDSSILSGAMKISRKQHEFAFQKLLSIGPKYPVPFKTIMAGSPEMKQRLENAVRSNQAKTVAKTTNQPKQTSSQPKIKLKMDFSNFK